MVWENGQGVREMLSQVRDEPGVTCPLGLVRTVVSRVTDNMSITF